MKLLVIISLLGVVACRKVPLYPRIEELLRTSTSIEHLFNETQLLISLTHQIMTRMATTGRLEIDTSLKNADASLDAVYQYSTNRTSTIASYLLDEIKTLEISATDLESCISLVPYVTSLNQVFDDQFKVVFSTSYYVASTTLENKYTGLQQNIDNVQGLNPTLTNCNLDEECIVDVANQVEEQNLALMNALDDIHNSAPTIIDQALNDANSSAARTLYVDEEYICNVATIIENCIRSRIDNPILTTTATTQATSPLPDSTTANTTLPPSNDTTVVTETTPGTTLAPITNATTVAPTTTSAPSTTLNPSIYCTHQTFSP